MIKSLRVIDNGLDHSQPARYEQHFGDGTIIYSNTIPDRASFKVEIKKATKFSIGDSVDVIADWALPEDLANNPWIIYGVIIELGHTFYNVESVAGNGCATFKEEALNIHD